MTTETDDNLSEIGDDLSDAGGDLSGAGLHRRIEALAKAAAELALEQGATAPCGDGDPCLGSDWGALCQLVGGRPDSRHLRAWHAAYRARLGEA